MFLCKYVQKLAETVETGIARTTIESKIAEIMQIGQVADLHIFRRIAEFAENGQVSDFGIFRFACFAHFERTHTFLSSIGVLSVACEICEICEIRDICVCARNKRSMRIRHFPRF